LLIASASSHFDHEGNLVDPEIRAALVELVETLRAWTIRLRLDAAA
jgi:hypothetical protein